MDALLRDLRQAVRALLRNPGMAVVAILCLALGIGANATMFGIVDALMFKAPAHIANPDGVVRIYVRYKSENGESSSAVQVTGYGTYLAFRDHVPAFQEVAAYWADKTTIGRGEDARPLDAELVTPSFFRALGTQPALGRFFAPDEERAEGNKAVVLGYDLWKGRFNGDRGVLGRVVDVGGQQYTVIGVAPPEFTGIDLKRVDAWLPIGAATTLFFPNALSHGSSYWLSTLARLPHGSSREVAAAQATAAFVAEHAKEPGTKGAQVEFAPIPVGRGPQMDDSTKVSLWLGLVSLLVLLVACANVANLLLARAVARSREIAVRLSLGAGRGRIAQQLLTESMVLAVLGASAALLLTVWTSAFVRRVVIPDVPLLGHAVSWRVLGFAGAAALGTGIVCGLAPAIVMARADLNAVLKGEARGRSGRFLVQRALVAGQVALTVVLLAGAGLFVQSLRNIQSEDLGMEVQHLLYARVDFKAANISNAEATAQYHLMLQRVRAVPGVTAASISIGEPFNSGWGANIIPTVGPATEVKQPRSAPMGRAVSEGFFRATARRFAQGRPFTAAEHGSSANVAIITQDAAHYYWPHGGALGACIHTYSSQKDCTTVVGVLADAPRGKITGPSQELYLPIEDTSAVPSSMGVSMMEVRTSGDPALLVAPVRHAMESAGADIPYPSVKPLTDMIDPHYRPWRLGTEMFGAFGVLALMLAAVGLYGVLAYAVVQQTRELGIRAALGAQRGALVRMVLRNGLTTATLGAGIGVLASLGAGRFIASLLYQVSPRDPVSLALAAGSLLAVAAVACYLPARRAARVDPMEALRAE
jgi:predicted permease